MELDGLPGWDWLLRRSKAKKTLLPSFPVALNGSVKLPFNVLGASQLQYRDHAYSGSFLGIVAEPWVTLGLLGVDTIALFAA